jgi:carbonic anhydrase
MIKIFLNLLLCVLIQNATGWAEIAPSEALQRLQEGNQRYIDGKLLHPDRSEERRLATAEEQNPFAVIVGCSDSRASPEILFDQGIGDLFIVRVAGNVVGPIEINSVEFAVEYLGASLVLVMGHENCGAVRAVMNGTTQDIEAVAAKIQPAIRKLPKKGPYALNNAIKANARYVAQELREIPLIKKLIDKNTLEILPAFYDFDTGKVEIIENFK